MATLSDAHKAFIVQGLARFDAPSEVRDALRAEHGAEASLAQIARYNPENAAANDLAQKWKDLFSATRKAFLDTVSGVAASHKAVRVRQLERMADDARQRKNYALAADLLEQIAKEMGDAFTNRRVVQGDPDRPLALAVMSKEDWERRAAERRSQVAAMGLDASPPLQPTAEPA